MRRRGSNDAFVDEASLPRYSRAEVSRHASAKDMWVVVGDKVYDFTRYIDKHPGGSKEIMQHAGGDATSGFRGPQHPEHVLATAAKFLIGICSEPPPADARASATGAVDGVAAALEGAGAGAGPA